MDDTTRYRIFFYNAEDGYITIPDTEIDKLIDDFDIYPKDRFIYVTNIYDCVCYFRCGDVRAIIQLQEDAM